jgi:hypothetical protein
MLVQLTDEEAHALLESHPIAIMHWDSLRSARDKIERAIDFEEAQKRKRRAPQCDEAVSNELADAHEQLDRLRRENHVYIGFALHKCEFCGLPLEADVHQRVPTSLLLFPPSKTFRVKSS